MGSRTAQMKLAGAERDNATLDQLSTDSLSVAVLLPCHNEAATIADVVSQFRAHLPGVRGS